MKTAVLVAALIVFGFSVSLPFVLTVQPDGLSWWGEQFPTLIFALTAAVMLLGIFLGCLFRKVTGNKAKVVKLRKELTGVLTSTSFIAALCISPFIFMSVYVIVNKSPGDPASYLLAFQNGFFCETIFGYLYSRTTQQPVPKNPQVEVI